VYVLNVRVLFVYLDIARAETSPRLPSNPIASPSRDAEHSRDVSIVRPLARARPRATVPFIILTVTVTVDDDVDDDDDDDARARVRDAEPIRGVERETPDANAERDDGGGAKTRANVLS